MTTATGDVAIDWSGVGDTNPYTHASLDNIDATAVQVLSGVLKPTTSALRRLRYNGAMGAGDVISAHIEVGNAGSSDYIYATIFASDGSGYRLAVNQTAVGIQRITAAGSVTGLDSATASSAASGDVFTLELTLSTNTLVGYLNDVAITGLSVVDTTYTTGLAPGLGFHAQNVNASTIRSWAGDGPDVGGVINTVTAEDTAEVVDAFVSLIGRLRDSAETTIISEGGLTSSALYNLLTSESVIAEDSFLRHVLTNRLPGDSLVLVDSFLSSITGIVVNTVTAEDVITVVDAFVSLIRRMRDSAETTIVSEGGLELTTLYNVIVEESLEITDSFLRRILATRTQADSIVSIDDFLSSVVGQGIVFAIASDAITVTWQALISSYFNRLNEENATTIDALLELSLFNTLASSLTSIIDDSLMQVSKFMSIVDSVDVIDDVASVFLPFTSADGSKIRIGIDQPRIELGGYPR